jgi:hypothetical protein
LNRTTKVGRKVQVLNNKLNSLQKATPRSILKRSKEVESNSRRENEKKGRMANPRRRMTTGLP